jgi:hypothetical protein
MLILDFGISPLYTHWYGKGLSKYRRTHMHIHQIYNLRPRNLKHTNEPMQKINLQIVMKVLTMTLGLFVCSDILPKYAEYRYVNKIYY